MKVLWLCNLMLPIISIHLGKKVSPVGGWLTGLSNDLLLQDDIELVVCFPNLNDNISGHVNKLKYYGFSNINNEADFTEIINSENPDIVHIFGTEYSHTLDMVNACEKMDIIDKVVINIQGLVSVIGKHYFADLPSSVVNGYTLRDFLRQDNIRQQRNAFLKRGESELVALEKVKHIIGRTDWDKACTSQINPTAKYHFCNETLRDEFYKHSWDIDNCEKYSIFLSQGYYPIKGLHYMLEAIPKILEKFPKTHIYITGLSPLNLKGKDKLRQGSYSKYLAKLIKKYNLENKITFLGSLNEKDMCERYLKSHIFVSASTVENESNSISEAKILGLPVVASFAGGVTNRIEDKVDGFFYQHSAPYMLAHYICEIFNDDSLALKFSKNAQKNANIMHNRKINSETMINIYNNIKI